MMRTPLGAPARAVVLAASALLVACSGPGPDRVADRFWAAARAGDVETLRRLSFESESASLDMERGRPAIERYELGPMRIEDDGAYVETSVVGSGETPIDVSFETVLVKVEGEWKVDLERTGERMMKAALESSQG